jgi:hypothetical protein
MSDMKSQKRIARYKRHATTKGQPYGKHVVIFKNDEVTITRHVTKGRKYFDRASVRQESKPASPT